MSVESKLWMGNVKGMNEKEIMEFFNEYNFYPENIQTIKDKKTNNFCNFCFVIFSNINEANDALITLDGKSIPNTYKTIKLRWANTNSDYMNIYVNNLSPEIDNFELYNLFKEKYTSVHHASIIKNKGYGIINFLDKEECEKCLKEMNGFLFHNKALEVKEMKKNNNHENNYEKENRKKIVKKVTKNLMKKMIL